MNKRTVCKIAIVIANLFVINSALSEVTSISNRKQPSVCGFSFAAGNELTVTATPISPAALRNRVDNERYDACPYNVFIKINQIAIRLDFGQDINLGRLKSVDEYGPVRTAYFRYDENGWEGAGEDIKIEKDEISKFETPDGVTVSGILMRENQQARKRDYCFSVLVIGKEKYATGGVCRIERAQLEKIRDMFSRKPTILAGQ